MAEQKSAGNVVVLYQEIKQGRVVYNRVTGKALVVKEISVFADEFDGSHVKCMGRCKDMDTMKFFDHYDLGRLARRIAESDNDIVILADIEQAMYYKQLCQSGRDFLPVRDE